MRIEGKICVCNRCGKRIMWAQSKAGKNYPIDVGGQVREEVDDQGLRIEIGWGMAGEENYFHSRHCQQGGDTNSTQPPAEGRSDGLKGPTLESLDEKLDHIISLLEVKAEETPF